MIGIDVYGVTTDAGGSNAGLFNSLKQKKNVTNSSWLETTDIGFLHPCSCPSHTIAFFYCGTHNFKNIRNALLNSIIDGTANSNQRCFVDVHNYSFGWHTVEKQFLRDRKRIQLGYSRATRLDSRAVVPNKYDKMAVEPAKNVFHQKSIIEHIISISKRLGCYNTMMTIIPDSKENYTTNEYITTEKKFLLSMRRLKFLRSISNSFLQLTKKISMPNRVVPEEDK